VLLAGDAMGVLARGLAALPPRQRAVVTRRDVHGLTPEEVCSVLDLNAGNQRVPRFLAIVRNAARCRWTQAV
jgi:DNA-directed RNA polymerase specialized sigma24 family protein